MNEVKLKLMIADDDEEILKNLVNFFTNHESIQVIGTATNGAALLQLLKKEKPDAILLDMVMPNIDGISVLEIIREDPEYDTVAVLMMSVIHFSVHILNALNKGADYYLLKPLDFSSLGVRIQKVREDLLNENKTKLNDITEDSIKEKIQNSLLKNGIMPHTLGYQYLYSSIYYIYKSDKLRYSMTKEIYPHIAELYGTSADCVDKAIRLSIRKAFDSENGKFKHFLSKYNYDSCPANGNFIKLMIQYLK